MTEPVAPISDEDLERVRRLLTREQVIPRGTVARLLARLDAAEVRVHDMAIALREVGQDRNRLAALARAVPADTEVGT